MLATRLPLACRAHRQSCQQEARRPAISSSNGLPSSVSSLGAASSQFGELKLPSAQPPPPPHHPSINPHPPRRTVQPSALHRVLVVIPAASSLLHPSLYPLIIPPSSCRPPSPTVVPSSPLHDLSILLIVSPSASIIPQSSPPFL